jgi:hypothetical protein
MGPFGGEEGIRLAPKRQVADAAGLTLITLGIEEWFGLCFFYQTYPLTNPFLTKNGITGISRRRGQRLGYGAWGSEMKLTGVSGHVPLT